MYRHRIHWLCLVALFLTGANLAPPALRAADDSHTFPETGKTVSGSFWTYWQTHGGLVQQGYPISGEMQETSDLNGQPYTVQYFERAVFEHHPENQAPFDVLLSQLGTFRYKAKYGTAGAPSQHTSADNPRVFPETGHTVGGVFRAYWESHGGLAQQGYPLSEEFTEVSDLNGKPYNVQYFERAVFELHPENAAPFNVLLSQLGTFRYKAKYESGGAPPTTTAGTGNPPPTATPAPAPPPNPGVDCSGIPASQNMAVSPACGPPGTTFQFIGSGFRAGERVGVYDTRPDGSVDGTPFQVIADATGKVTGITIHTLSASPTGVWALTMEGTSSHAKAIGYFKITATSAGPPPSGCDVSGDQNGQATPSSSHVGQTLILTAQGFTPGEAVSFWFTTPNGNVVGTRAPASGLVNPDGTIGPLPITLDTRLFGGNAGRWAITFQGATSHHQAVIYFCVEP